eukprot:Awhi_evm1s13355
MFFGNSLLCLASLSVAFTNVCGSVVPPVNYKIGIKALILSNSFDLDALPQQILHGYGANFDLVRVVNEYQGKEEFSLNFYETDASGVSIPKYNSIILISPGLEYHDNVTDLYPSALSPEQWQQLSDYRNKYDIRTVALSSGPNVDPALSYASGYDSGVDSHAELRFIPNSTLAQSLKTNLQINATFRFGSEYPLQADVVRYYWYPISIDASLNQDNHITPFLEARNIETAATEYTPIAYLLDIAGKAQELHFAFTSNTFDHHSLALGDLWFVWVTRGIFLGQRRLLLNTQVDDFFLMTGQYPHVENGEEARVTKDDVYLLDQFQKDKKASLPSGSNFTFEMAINGRGFVMENMSNPEAMEYHILKMRDSFNWLSHTFSHMDMYCMSSNCTVPDEMPPVPDCVQYNATFACSYPLNEETWEEEPIYPKSGYSPKYMLTYELSRNNWFARNILFGDVLDEDFVNWPTWSPHSIVTPRISGLNYSVAIEAMLEAEIYSAVGDSSRKDLQPDSIYHLFNARPLVGVNGTQPYDPNTFTPINNKTGLSIIPRFSTRIYYDVSYPELNAKEHNDFYGPTCQGYNSTGDIVFGGNKCNVDSFKYPKDLTFEEMMEIEGYETARNMLSYRTDPYMFHQGNLHFYDGKNCILCTWVDSVLKWVTQYSTFPIFSYKQDDLEEFYRTRKERDDCEPQLYLEVVNGKPSQVYINKNESVTCHVKVTITPTEGNEDLVNFNLTNVNANVEKEVYGVDSTYTFN